MPIDPTARADMEAELMRRWYERHRESWWARYWRSHDVADVFMLCLLFEAKRVAALSDTALSAELG